MRHFVPIGKFKLELQSGNAQFGSKSAIFCPVCLEIWRMTLKNNRASVLCYFKLCTSFRSHKWIQTGVTVRKRLNWVLTSVTLTLTFDLWPWPFVWTSPLSLVITSENFSMIRWREHSKKRCDRYIVLFCVLQPCNFAATKAVLALNTASIYHELSENNRLEFYRHSLTYRYQFERIYKSSTIWTLLHLQHCKSPWASRFVFRW